MDFGKLQAEGEAIRRITENGPSLLYIIFIYCAGALGFITLMLRKSRKKRKKRKRTAGAVDFLFLLWTVFANIVLVCVLLYLTRIRLLPAVSGTVYSCVFVGLLGTCVSIIGEYNCRRTDSRYTRAALASEDGFKGRIWMHTCTAIVVSVAVLLIAR
jgi:hypothetical protein